MANLTRAARCVSAAAALLLLIGCAAISDRSTPADPRPDPTATNDGAAVPPIEPEPVAPEPDPAPESAPQAVPDAETGPEPAPRSAPVAPDDPSADPTDGSIAAPRAVPAARPPAPVNEPIRVGGRIRLNGERADVAETVLYFVPDQSTAAAEPGTFELATRDKAFIPTVLVVPSGSMIRFPNRDPILHNVFSVSSGNAFDLGVYGPGSVPDTTLDTAGAVNVYCNVHHDMHAHVLVLDTPWFERADSDGRFVLSDLPPGPGTLHAWHRQADAWSVRIDASAGEAIEVVLDIVRPQLPAHLDKSGQSYQRRDRDPYR